MTFSRSAVHIVSAVAFRCAPEARGRKVLTCQPFPTADIGSRGRLDGREPVPGWRRGRTVRRRSVGASNFAGPLADGDVSASSEPPLSRPQIHLLHVVPVPLPEIVGGLGGLDTGLVSVDPDPKEDIKHVGVQTRRGWWEVWANLGWWRRQAYSISIIAASCLLNAHPQIAEAKEFIKRRFVTKLATRNIAYKVEIVHFLTDNDSIGEAICTRAEALKAATVVVAKHQRGVVAEFFMGSVTKVCG